MDLHLLQAAPPSLRRLQLYIHAEEDHSTSSAVGQRPALRLHYVPLDVDVDHDEYHEPIYSPTQTISSATELYYAVRQYAAKHDVEVALDDNARCVVFHRS